MKALPIWIDLASTDVAGSRAFYEPLLGWETQELPPEAGGYAFFSRGGRIAAAAGPTQGPGQPTAWQVYFGTDDADETARKVTAAGGTVVAPPFDVLDQGRMAVFQDPSGAFFSVWQPKEMAGLELVHEPGGFDWCELDARGIQTDKAFYRDVFGWSARDTDDGQPYTMWEVDGEDVGGGMEMPGTVPAEVPSFWQVYFRVADLEAAAAKVGELGGTVMMGPEAYPGGRFVIAGDPQGATFGLLIPK